MKIAFNILPVITEYERMHLLIVVGDYGASFVWFTNDPCNIRGLAIHNLTDELSIDIMADKLYNILYSSSIFDKQYASVNICYDFNQSLLIPESYYDASSSVAMVNLVYAADADSNYKTDALKSDPSFNIYAVDKKTDTVLSQKFPAAIFHHATSLELTKLVNDSQALHCIFFHNSIKVFLFSVSGLQLVQYFNYSTEVDVAYHLLNCCEQNDIDPSVVKLILSGMIDEKSKLYSELYRYFLHIELEQPDMNIELHDRIKFYPPHFFSHLTGLASCVS